MMVSKVNEPSLCEVRWIDPSMMNCQHLPWWIINFLKDSNSLRPSRPEFGAPNAGPEGLEHLNIRRLILLPYPLQAPDSSSASDLWLIVVVAWPWPKIYLSLSLSLSALWLWFWNFADPHQKTLGTKSWKNSRHPTSLFGEVPLDQKFMAQLPLQ